jgi:hypothetical protein
MPIFRLKPVASLLEDAAWRNSPVSDELWVNAADEAEARGLASGRYEAAGTNIPGVSSGASPWLDPRLVQAVAEQTGPGGRPIPAGVVLGDRQM